MWTIHHGDRPTVRTLTEAGIVGKIGVSDARVGVLLNILGHERDAPPIGIPVHALNRGLLDRAADGVEAIRILSTAAVSASSADRGPPTRRSGIAGAAWRRSPCCPRRGGSEYGRGGHAGGGRLDDRRRGK
ncbi:MAG TPA: hypothetical protein VMU66_03410, partial [Gaiellales bacterium]|nr:hypothetical protein [Gaiellales bacterium]